MQFQITPFLVGLIFIVGYAAYSWFETGEKKSLGFVMLGFLVPSLLAIFGLDYLMQHYFFHPWIDVIQGVVIGIALLYYKFGKRHRTIVLPDNFSMPFIVVIFNVEGTPLLPRGNKFSLHIPNEGILCTSTRETDIPLNFINRFECSSGEKLPYLTGEYQWAPCELEMVEIDGKKFFFKWWAHQSIWGNEEAGHRVKAEIIKKLKSH